MPGVPGTGSLIAAQDDGVGDPIRITIDGQVRWWRDLSDSEKRAWRKANPERYRGEGADSGDELGRLRAQEREAAQDVGVVTGGDPESQLMAALEQAGVNTNDPTVSNYVQTVAANVRAGAYDMAAAQARVQPLAFNPAYRIQNPYTVAFEESGFSDVYTGDPLDFYGPGATAVREGGVTPSPAPPFIESEQGWIQYSNGVLVSPDDQVAIDPASDVPGSAKWLRGINDWSAERIREEKQKLVQFGWLPEGAAKSTDITAEFRDALKNFHYARYINGGSPIGGSFTGADTAAERPKPVDLREFDSQIRNDVRDQYERIFGYRPGDGETEMWSDFVIKKGMEMQRRNIGKYDSPMTESAATEAEEQLIEKLERTPQARLLRDSDEENTRLRDTLTRMASVTDSLVT